MIPCYRASLPSHRAERLDGSVYPDVGANRVAALETMVRLSINALAHSSGGELVLGKLNETDNKPMPYLQALGLGLHIYNFQGRGVRVDSPSVSLPLRSKVTLTGKHLAVPGEKSATPPTPEKAQGGDVLTMPKKDGSIPVQKGALYNR